MNEAWATSPAPYVRRETMVSGFINAVLSVAFFFLVFGFAGLVPVWGIGAFAFDFLPQSFAIGLMASLVPGLLARKAIVCGRIGGTGRLPGIGKVLLPALRNAAASGIIGAVIAAALLYAFGADTLRPLTALLIKTIYGALLGAVVTRLFLYRLIRPNAP